MLGKKTGVLTAFQTLHALTIWLHLLSSGPQIHHLSRWGLDYTGRLYTTKAAHLFIQIKPKWELMWKTCSRICVQLRAGPSFPCEAFLLHAPSVAFKDSPLTCKVPGQTIGKVPGSTSPSFQGYLHVIQWGKWMKSRLSSIGALFPVSTMTSHLSFLSLLVFLPVFQERKSSCSLWSHRNIKLDNVNHSAQCQVDNERQKHSFTKG